MTVCVAAIAKTGMIVGAADRMVSIGHLESEPDRSKIYHATDYPISFLYAGGLSLFAEVTHAAFAKVTADPGAFRTVGDFANLYGETCSEVLARKAETLILRARGLTLAELNRNAPSVVPPDERSALLSRIATYEPDAPMEVLIVGQDATDGRPHLWRVFNRYVDCLDTDGFAAIGIGAEESENHFRVSGFTRGRASVGRTMLTTYVAKCRGERAAGVGRATNMFLRAPGLEWVRITASGIKKLHALYRQLCAEEQAANRNALTAMEAYVMREPNDAATVRCMLQDVARQLRAARGTTGWTIVIPDGEWDLSLVDLPFGESPKKRESRRASRSPRSSP